MRKIKNKYLYEKIREFVADEPKDILYPLPQEQVISDSEPAKDRLDGNESNAQTNVEQNVSIIPPNHEPGTSHDDSSIPSKRKPPTCSYCGETGHRNLFRNGKYFCKKRQSESSRP